MLPHEWGSELTRVIGLCWLDWPSIAALSEFSKQKVCVIDRILDAHSLVHLGFYGRNRDGIRQAHMGVQLRDSHFGSNSVPMAVASRCIRSKPHAPDKSSVMRPRILCS